jgi:hypothetical protein
MKEGGTGGVRRGGYHEYDMLDIVPELVLVVFLVPVVIGCH